MKRPYFEVESVLSPPDSPNKTPNYGICRETRLLVPYSRAEAVDASIALLLNSLTADDGDMRDDFVVDKPGKILVFLDAQGKQYIEDLQRCLYHKFQVPIVFISSGLNAGDDILTTSNEQCMILSKYFSVLDPLGGGSYPLNRLMFVSDDLIRVNVPLKVNYNNRFERFGVPLHELPGILQEIVPYLY